MASSVFGVPITEETLRATGEYKEPITQSDVAEYAMKMINAGDKDVNAQKFVDNLKDRYGNGITTKCLIYNATGTTLNFVDYKDWHGHIYDTPQPSEIQNGQWAVYRTKIPSENSSCDWLFSWSIPYIGNNRVYTEIREEGHFPQHWDYIYHDRLENSGGTSTDEGYGYRSNTNIGQGTTVNARAIFELPK